MEKKLDGLDQLPRWIIGGALLAYGWKAGGWRRWAAYSVASSLLTTAGPQRRFVNQLLGLTTEKKTRRDRAEALVQETSEESFPASDAPAWAGQR